MSRVWKSCCACLWILLIANSLQADLEMPDEPRIAREKAAIVDAFRRSDVPLLLRQLQDCCFFTRPAVALALARLDVQQALPELKRLNAQYANFACAETGEFGVAVILLEHDGRAAEKRALLEVATADPQGGVWPHSVIDRAGRELALYDGDDLFDLLHNVRTYGAQYAALSLQLRDLPLDQQIQKSVDQLREHVTPQAAEAAQEILTGLGPAAADRVRALLAASREIVERDGPLSTAGTVVNRCERILDAYESQAAAHVPSEK